MNKYNNGKVYGFYVENELIYIGSTTLTIEERKQHHIYSRNSNKMILYDYLNKNNIKEFEVRLIEKYSCNTLIELRLKEGEYQRLYNPICNSRIAGRSGKETNTIWRENNKEYIKEQKKKYAIENKEHIAQYKRDNSYKGKVPFNCECGGKYTLQHKKRHFNCKKHLEYEKNNIL